MPANTDPRPMIAERYYYRRRLGVRELLPAVAIGVGVGVAAFYIARLLAQRTPLRAADATPRLRSRPGRSSGVAG
jgi:hypothetical protein